MLISYRIILTTTRAAMAWKVIIKAKDDWSTRSVKNGSTMNVLRLRDDDLTCIFWLLYYLGYIDNLFTILFLFSYLFQGLFSAFVKTLWPKISLLLTNSKLINVAYSSLAECHYSKWSVEIYNLTKVIKKCKVCNQCSFNGVSIFLTQFQWYFTLKCWIRSINKSWVFMCISWVGEMPSNRLTSIFHD